jgi:hypothetical protein
MGSRVKRVEFSTREEWREWRKERICASDYPIIMGHSSHKTVQQLLEEKTADELPPEPSEHDIKGGIFAAGHAAEEIILKKFLNSESGAHLRDRPYYTQYCLEGSRNVGSYVARTFDNGDKLLFNDYVKVGATLDVIFPEDDLFIEIKTLPDPTETPLYFLSQMAFQAYLIKGLFGKPFKGILLKANSKAIEANPEEFPLHIKQVDKDVHRHVNWCSVRHFHDMWCDPSLIPKEEPIKNTAYPKQKALEEAFVEADRVYREAKEKMEAAKEALLEGLDKETSYSGSLVDIRRSRLKGRVNYDSIEALCAYNFNEYRTTPSIRTSFVVKSIGKIF